VSYTSLGGFYRDSPRLFMIASRKRENFSASMENLPPLYRVAIAS
jgi:hypothetical protein